MTARRVAPALVGSALAVPAVVLGLARHQPLSWDEAVTVTVASHSVPAIAATVRHSDAVLGVYYLLVHGWAAVLHASGIRPTEVWWRAPSAVAAVVTCGLVASCARRLAGPAAGVTAGGLLAVLPLFGFYAVDARPYALAAMTVTAAWWVWTRPRGTLSLRSATLPVALLVGAAWLQLFTVLVWPAFLLAGGRTRARRGILALAVAGLGTTPILLVALTQSSEIGWIPRASAVNTVRVALHVGGGLAVVGAVAVVAAAALRAGLVRRGPMTAAVLWWSFAPLTLLAALDLVRPVLVARYALVSLPLAAVGFAVVVVRAHPGRPGLAVRVAAVATLLAAVVTSGRQSTRPWKYEDYRGAAAFATSAVPPGTPVLFTPSSARLGFDLYAGRHRLRDVALPSGLGADPLAIAERPTGVVRAGVDTSCTVVVFGDPLPTPRPTADRVRVSAVSGWLVDVDRHFGQVTVTVLHNPVCRPRRVGSADPVPDPDARPPRTS